MWFSGYGDDGLHKEVLESPFLEEIKKHLDVVQRDMILLEILTIGRQQDWMITSESH